MHSHFAVKVKFDVTRPKEHLSHARTGAGAALQRVLAENKGALRERKGAAKDLAAKVNECKKWIDDLRGEVEALNTNRGGSTEGGNEPLVLDEEDFRIVVELKVG